MQHARSRDRDKRQLPPGSLCLAARMAARRRFKASIGVSPGRISEDGLAGSAFFAVGAGWIAATRLLLPVLEIVVTVATVPACAASVPCNSGAVGLGRARQRRRLIGLRPSSRLSHSRSASSEIVTPNLLSPMPIAATDSPARRSLSSSSRCASSCDVTGCFGQRESATSSESVGSGSGAESECSGSSEGVIWEWYSQRHGSAMGVVLPQSKPRGLDVGVLTYAFILEMRDEFTSWGLLPLWRVLILRLVGVSEFSFGVSVLLVVLLGGVYFLVTSVSVGSIELTRRWSVELSFGPLGSADFCGGGSW